MSIDRLKRTGAVESATNSCGRADHSAIWPCVRMRGLVPEQTEKVLLGSSEVPSADGARPNSGSFSRLATELSQLGTSNDPTIRTCRTTARCHHARAAGKPTSRNSLASKGRATAGSVAIAADTSGMSSFATLASANRSPRPFMLSSSTPRYTPPATRQKFTRSKTVYAEAGSRSTPRRVEAAPGCRSCRALSTLPV